MTLAVKVALIKPQYNQPTLRTGGGWLNPWLRQYSFGGLMIVIATGFIPLSLLSIVSTVVMWESS